MSRCAVQFHGADRGCAPDPGASSILLFEGDLEMKIDIIYNEDCLSRRLDDDSTKEKRVS